IAMFSALTTYTYHMITSITFTLLLFFSFFFFNDTATTEIYTLSLHDALPIWAGARERIGREGGRRPAFPVAGAGTVERRGPRARSEEHTSELQSPCNLVCRLLLEKKKKKKYKINRKKIRKIRNTLPKQKINDYLRILNVYSKYILYQTHSSIFNIL